MTTRTRAAALAETALMAVAAYEPATGARWVAHSAAYDVDWIDQARGHLLAAIDRQPLPGTNEAIGTLSAAKDLALRWHRGDIRVAEDPTCVGCYLPIEPGGWFRADPWRHLGCAGVVGL